MFGRIKVCDASLYLFLCQRGAEMESSTVFSKKAGQNLPGVPLASPFGAISIRTSIGMSRVSIITTRLFISEGVRHYSTYVHKLMQVTSINKLTIFGRRLSTLHHDVRHPCRGAIDPRTIWDPTLQGKRIMQRDVSLDASSETQGTLMH